MNLVSKPIITMQPIQPTMSFSVVTRAIRSAAFVPGQNWHHQVGRIRPLSTATSALSRTLTRESTRSLVRPRHAQPRTMSMHSRPGIIRRYSDHSAAKQPIVGSSRLGHHTCPACHMALIPVTSPLCPTCSRPLPLHPSTSYFELLLPSSHNLEQLPTALDLYNLDLAAVKRHFLTIQRAIHPDKLVGQVTEVKDVADATSAKVNKALDVVGKDRVARGEYLLQLLGIPLTESDSSADTDSPASSTPMTSPDLLMFIMETREQIQDAESPADLDAVQQEVAVVMEEAIKDFEAALSQLPNPLAPGIDLSSVNGGAGAGKEAKEAAARVRYFRNVLRAVEDRREELER
ncbi:hypothetical protein BCR44DRAFT_1067542 [Catenaria anguillulae PL171]|uniref:Co-chaperone HscB C-terminal oligomerisation domain-containing protein n=1 Tax=Catenaria anguillulae PL171 TaxID=765915 RepID=A0A1Y2HS58_9FUNG|nr:hypothetical protein BCR44DRAFT_1067542 [Catenaria anguillulae PL171]